MKYVKRLLLVTVILGMTHASALMGYAQQSNDYAQYEQQAWKYMHQENREELLPTIILSNLNQAIDLAPERVRTDSYRLRSLCWRKAGENDKSFQDDMVVIQREPNNPKSASSYGKLATELGCQKDFKQAMEYIERSIELVPDNAATRATRALLYVEMGEWDKWEEELRIAIELDSNVTNIVSIQDMVDAAEKRKRESQP